MIQPNARPATRKPAGAPGPAGRPAPSGAIKPTTQRPVSLITGRPVNKATTATRRPIATSTGGTVRKPAGATAATVKRPVSLITGRPIIKTSTTTGRRPTATVTHTATGRRPIGHATTVRSKGAHHPAAIHRPGVRVPHTGATRTGVTGTARKHVTGWPHHGKKHVHGHPAGTTIHHGTMATRRTKRHPGAKTTVIRHGHHVPGQRTVYYTPGGAPVESVQYVQQPGQPGQYMPTSVSTNQSTSYGQPMPMGQPTPGGMSVGMPTAQPMPSGGGEGCATRRPCHNCGTSVRGCTTLSRFAFNSAELKNSHKAQLRQLAERILAQSSNTVVTTGHTDSSGTEDYNEALGEKRAATVVKELKKQLSLLQPGSQKHLFWKIDSKGETRPVSQTDAAANRRVSICVKKGSFSK